MKPEHRTSNIQHPTSNKTAPLALRRSMLDVRCSMFVLPLLCLGLSGCGYTRASGYKWQSLYRQDVQTVAVPTFSSRAEPGVEFKLSSAVIHQLETVTPYKVVPRERADTILECEILSMRTEMVSLSPHTATPQEQLLTISVNFTWKDLRTGRILVQRRNFDQSSTFYPTLGEGQFVGTQQAVERLAIAMIQELQSDW